MDALSLGTAIPVGGFAGNVARGQAPRQRAFHGKEGGRPNTRAKRAKRDKLRLPDELFSIIVRYYWGGGMSAEEEAAAPAEALAVAKRPTVTTRFPLVITRSRPHTQHRITPHQPPAPRTSVARQAS